MAKKTSKGMWVWAILCVLGLVSDVVSGKASASFAVMKHLNVWWALSAIPLIIVVITISEFLEWAFPWSKVSWLSLFNAESFNVNMAPTRIPWFGLAFAGLTFINLPNLALLEENLFRLGTSNWKTGAVRSLTFGLCHCIVGVGFNVGLALSFAGMWFTFAYFRGGVELSAGVHSIYNMILFAILGAVLIHGHLQKIGLVRSDSLV